MKKIYYISILVIILIVSFLGITYSFEYGEENDLTFELIGPTDLYLDVGTEYTEYGIKVKYNGMDITNKIKIDKSELDTQKLGNYKVKYEYNNEYVYRNVNVIDKEAPIINLMGGEEVYILLGGKYQEAGYNITDNYDKDLNSKVKVEGTVNTNKEGSYQIIYKVSDSSGNSSEVSRTVIVKKAEINIDNNLYNRVSPTSYNITNYPNTIIINKFNDNGIYYEGYVKDRSDSYKIVLKNQKNKMEYVYNMTVTKNNYYRGNLNLNTVNNGTYDIYIVGLKEERLLNKLDVYSRIVRAKVSDKLVSFNYDNDNVTVKIEDFEYKYDFVIDPGHGGSNDIGASNGITLEKNLNLQVSKYEKCRYESMGYRVYMTRYDDSKGEILGNNTIDILDRRAFTIGYYATVSKVAYSNHHNGSLDTAYHGFEILVQNNLSKDKLEVEMSLYDKFKKFYNLNDNEIRIYGKDYESSMILDKASGKIYNDKNYYSILRIPYELFNVKNTIYEPIYMTNANDFNWYYASNNWIYVSELKIKEYVNYLGGTYKSDNRMCL